MCSLWVAAVCSVQHYKRKKCFIHSHLPGPVHFPCFFLCHGPRACATGGVVCAISSKRPPLYVPTSERVYDGFTAGLKPKCVIREGLWRIDYSAGLCCTSEPSLCLFSPSLPAYLSSPCLPSFITLTLSLPLPPSCALSLSLIHSFSSHLFTR